jgi:acetyltransferase-like isoleucine patch superfamily enzyme
MHGSMHVRPAGLASLGSGSYLAEPYRVRSPHRVHIGRGVSIGERSVLSVVDELNGERYGGILRIGDDCAIGTDFYVHCAGEIAIGSDVRIGARVFVCDSSRDMTTRGLSPLDLDIGKAEAVRIGDGATIGLGAMILPGVTVGEGARVTAGSTVTRNVPPGYLAKGNPARLVRPDAERRDVA